MYASCISQVFRALVRHLPRKPAVDSFMIDFEAPLWTVVRKVFKDALVKGCVFHLTQAVWRHVQLLGLQRAYNEHNRTHRFIR